MPPANKATQLQGCNVSAEAHPLATTPPLPNISTPPRLFVDLRSMATEQWGGVGGGAATEAHGTAGGRAAVGSMFVDHGPGYILRDKDGKEPLMKLVTKMVQKEEEVKREDGSVEVRPWARRPSVPIPERWFGPPHSFLRRRCQGTNSASF